MSCELMTISAPSSVTKAETELPVVLSDSNKLPAGKHADGVIVKFGEPIVKGVAEARS